MRPKYYTCIAGGVTYPHKEDLQSWAFWWDPNRKAWIRKGIDEDDKKLFLALVNGIPSRGIAPKWPHVLLTFVEEPRNDMDDVIDDAIQEMNDTAD